jgi:putative oxidoreductase
MNNLLALLASHADNGRMILRVVTGIIIFIAGYTKVFVWGLGNVQNAFANMGILVPQISGPFIALLELIGGLLLIAGLFTRQVAVLFFIQFIVATYVVWAGKGFAGARLELMLLFVFLMLATNGSGPLSIDRNVRKRD